MIKKIISVISIIICSFILYGCNGNYFGPGTSDFHYELPGKYQLYKAGTAEIWSESKVKIIGGDVTGIAWNEDSILVQQKVEKNTSYWIIYVKEGKLYGPLDEKDFELQKKTLKISTNLKLEPPKKYKYLEKQISENK